MILSYSMDVCENNLSDKVDYKDDCEHQKHDRVGNIIDQDLPTCFKIET